VKRLWQQYKQVWERLKIAPIVVDTLTTRFLLLFLFLLSIPLITVIIFTTSLLANHLDDAANSQLQFSQNLFKASIEEARLNLAAQESLTDACPQNNPERLCLKINENSNTLQEESPEHRPIASRWIPADFQGPLRQPVGMMRFFARWNQRLFLVNHFRNGRNEQVFQGVLLDSAFINRIYRQQPNLQTELWILPEPITPDSATWFGQSVKSPYNIPQNSVLRAIQLSDRAFNNQPITLTVDKTPYRVIQEPIYSVDNEKIARIVHVLPLTQTQMLLNNYYIGIYVIAVASLIFSVLLAMGAGRTITQPLLRLIVQVNTLSRESVMKESDEVLVSGVYEIRQLGEAFNRMIKHLRQEHRMKDEFVATLTHDLKVPMLAEKQTISYFRTGSYGPLTPDQHEVLDIMQSSNRSCLSLVNGLLEVYRYDSGSVSLVFERFNLARLLEETASELQSLVREKALTLSVKIELDAPDEAAQTYADRLELKRVLHNLVSNAIINTPTHGGTIECTITDADRYGSDTLYKVSSLQSTTLKQPVILENRLLVMIRDAGVGFANEDLPNLFRQFAASKGRNPMSIGLGLYNCYQVIQAHHGVLWVESTEGEGSIVSFILAKGPDTIQDRRIYSDRRKRTE
jgi:signal transduction histidine kinase